MYTTFSYIYNAHHPFTPLLLGGGESSEGTGEVRKEQNEKNNEP
jgi:hypothetical protein